MCSKWPPLLQFRQAKRSLLSAWKCSQLRQHVPWPSPLIDAAQVMELHENDWIDPRPDAETPLNRRMIFASPVKL